MKSDLDRVANSRSGDAMGGISVFPAAVFFPSRDDDGVNVTSFLIFLVRN